MSDDLEEHITDKFETQPVYTPEPVDYEKAYFDVDSILSNTQGVITEKDIIAICANTGLFYTDVLDRVEEMGGQVLATPSDTAEA